MRSIIMHDNGRLKTGRLSLLLFLGLVLASGLLFKMHQPVDKAIVIVRHIFTATPEAETKKSPLKKSEKPAPVSPQKQVKVAAKTPVNKPKNIEKAEELQPGKAAVTAPTDQKVIPKETEQTREKLQDSDSQKQASVKPLTVPEPLPTPLDETVIEVSPDKVAKSTTEQAAAEENTLKVSKKEPAQALKGVVESAVENNSQPAGLQTDRASEVELKMEPEELVVDHHQIFNETVALATPAVSLMSESARQEILKNLAQKDFRSPVADDSQFKALHLAAKKSPPKEIKPEKRVAQAAVKLPVKKIKKSAEPVPNKEPVPTSSITVDSKAYSELHRAWRVVGAGKKDNNRIIPLRIENLRTAYSFLQMKAVVIMADESCLDLSDGSRIPLASLNRFSSTVMQVDDPWQKWGDELREAGLQPGQPFKIRYYLYDFVKRSIYTRVNQAYNWSLHKGLIKADTKPGDIDVLGRAFVVKRAGGGSFGVFVPLSIATRNGDNIDIDPLCFNDAPDIIALRKAGVI